MARTGPARSPGKHTLASTPLSLYHLLFPFVATVCSLQHSEVVIKNYRTNSNSGRQLACFWLLACQLVSKLKETRLRRKILVNIPFIDRKLFLFSSARIPLNFDGSRKLLAVVGMVLLVVRCIRAGIKIQFWVYLVQVDSTIY
mgnify:CR=1 FL=1